MAWHRAATKALRQLSQPAMPAVRSSMRSRAAERVQAQQRQLCAAATAPGSVCTAGRSATTRGPLRMWEVKASRALSTVAPPLRSCRVLVRVASDGTLVYCCVDDDGT